MTHHIGIVACSAEGAALCYRTIVLEAEAELGEYDHPEITMSSVSLARYMEAIRADDWAGVAELMLHSARLLARAGAEFAICPDNTIHQAFDLVSARSPIPWLHIARAVGEEAKRQGFRKLGITGTRYLMEGPVYPGVLGELGIDSTIPAAEDRARIDAIIFGELVKGRFSEAARRYFSEVFERLGAAGCDAVVLGCTEIPLLVRADDTPLPTLDSTRLLARAALARAVLSQSANT